VSSFGVSGVNILKAAAESKGAVIGVHGSGALARADE